MNKPLMQPESGQTLRDSLSIGDRPQKPSALSSTLTFGRRALLKIKHLPEQLIDVTLLPVVFLLMFTYLFGGAIAGSTGDYLHFLLPGILVMNVTMITIYTGTDLNKDITKGVFDRFRTLPIWRPSILVGSLLVDTVRYTIAITIMIVLGMVLGFRPDGGVTGVMGAKALLLVFSFSLSWVWTTLGLIMRSENSLFAVSMAVIFPMTFASNVFVDPETMPSWLQGFVEVNPISLLVTAVRGLMYGTATFGQISLVLLSSVVLTAIFAPLTMYLYRHKQ
jgi:ABC-2 type transport system permease protein